MLNFTLETQPEKQPINVALTKDDDGDMLFWLLNAVVARLDCNIGVLVMQHLTATEIDRLRAADISLHGDKLEVG